ncbi:hypothetical protein [Amycolatopsis sp. 195334CR]|uniref:hypothetical protein n=1 Tax=Amycolatopsis sp. 195334CR TaxID=2814588 RepID=UPI001A8F140E|nr:hypothetical protein [Amycolatopsis sp. 195334CR]MBN6038495.1 hypothetical protein [Amycolatopsis sp. 195334CR]
MTTPETEADRIAAAVLALPDVAGLHGGRFGDIATLAARRRVTGIRVRDEDLTIAVSVRYPFSATEVAASVRAAVGRPERAVHVFIADLVDGPDRTAEEPEEEKIP